MITIFVRNKITSFVNPENINQKFRKLRNYIHYD